MEVIIQPHKGQVWLVSLSKHFTHHFVTWHAKIMIHCHIKSRRRSWSLLHDGLRALLVVLMVVTVQ